MYDELNKFIRNHFQSLERDVYTHVSQITPLGKINIDRKDTEEFFRLYSQTLIDNPNAILGLAEKPSKYLPIYGDIDLKIEYKVSDEEIKKMEKMYTDVQAKQIISIYQKTIKKIVKDYKKEYAVCCLLEKKYPTVYPEQKKISHGFHIHFIYPIMSNIDQDIHLIPRVRQEVSDKRIFENLGIEDSGTVIDKTCSKTWLMYGSRKKENLQSYKLTKIYDEDLQELKLGDVLRSYNLRDTFDDPIPIDKNIKYYIPRLLSIHCENRQTDVVETFPELKIISDKKMKSMKEFKIKYDDDSSIEEKLKKTKEIMSLISSTRADTYQEWIDIGWTLFCIGNGCQEAFDLWVDFSRKTSKNNFSEKGCYYEWNKMENKGRTLGTLMFIAGKDSTNELKNLKEKYTSKFINEALLGGHNDLAKILYEKYQNEYKCACVYKHVWYTYRNNRWFIDDKGITLSKKISTELVDKFKSLKKRECSDMGDEEVDDSESPERQKKIKNINKILSSLKSAPFKNNIMKESEEFFFDRSFSKSLDTNKDVLGFSNGVLDISTMCFREGKPADLISLTTDYDFKEFTENDIDVLEVHEFLNKIFPDFELKDFFLTYCAELLRGGNFRKTVLVNTGVGDNGKSVIIELLTLALGEYIKVFPTTFLTGKRTQSSGATPETSNIQGKRLAVLQEPSNGDVMNLGVLKEFSGNDSVYVRGLYKDPVEVRPMFKLMVICNHLPRLPCDDPAAWNRILVLPFEAIFPKDSSLVPDTPEEQIKQKIFKRDNSISDKFPRMKYAFMWILFQRYIDLTNGTKKYSLPEKVKSATIEYRKNNDIFHKYIYDHLVEAKESEITVSKLYLEFKDFYLETYPNMRSLLPSRDDMVEDFAKRGFKVKQGKIKGFKFRETEDDTEHQQDSDLLKIIKSK